MKKYYRAVPMAEFTYLQKRVLKELLHPQWEWRTEQALMDAIEDARKDLRWKVADDYATLLDREESGQAVMDSLKELDMFQIQKQIHFVDNQLTEKTWYALAKRFKNNRNKF